MRPITFPLDRTSQGSEVSNLQDGLLLLLRRRAVRILESDQPTFEAGLQREQTAQTYADFTQRIITSFQRSSDLRPTGEVDQPTAEALNRALRELGAFEQAAQFVVRGQVL